MFEKLVITNFQKHSHLEIDLDPEVTTIVGPSDAGKSAVIRALRWLCQNSPSGIEFLKNGQTTVAVDLVVDGKLVKRLKSPSSNLYSIDGSELKAFGQGVPDSVASLLNVDPINFQSQMDAPYWLSLSPGEVSRQLNSLIDLSIIDETTKNINRMVSRSRVELDLAEERAKKKQEQLDELDWVSECLVDAGVVQAAEKNLANKQIDLADLKIMYQDLLGFSNEADRLRTKLAAVADIGKQASYVRTQQQVLDGVAGVLNEVKSLQSVLQFRTISTEDVDIAKSALSAAVETLWGIKKIITEARQVAQKVKNKQVAVDFALVESAHDAYCAPKKQLDGLKKLVSEIETKDLEMVGFQLRFSDAEKDIKEKSAGQICPVCGKFGL